MCDYLNLSTGETSMRLRPDWGGRVAALCHAGRDLLYPLQEEDGFDPALWPKGGAYPLFPFHNRIPDGHFNWAGRDVTLPLHPHEDMAVHGHAHQHPWKVECWGSDRALLVYDDHGRDAWPWAFSARQEFILESGRLVVALRITNRAGEPMPAGLGWHPYFVKASRVETDATREWDIGTDLLPTGASHAARPHAAVTRYLSDWSRAELWLETGVTVRILATPPLTHLVIHDPDGPYSCVEPVSHLANAMNLRPARGADSLITLSPGDSVEGRIVMTFGLWEG